MIQVLCATMRQTDFSLVRDMNIQTDVIFANQNGRNDVLEEAFDGFNAKMICTDTVGVGINRNMAVMYSDADICLIADDDIRYVDEYENIVCKAFRDNPDADVLLFNLYGDDENYVINKKFRVRKHNFMRFGAVRIAFKSSAIKTCGIFFNTSFGGGCLYQSGEDTLFLKDCLDKKLKIYALPIYIAEIKNERPSTWFNGYDRKFLYDKGALLAAVSKPFSYIMCLRLLVVKKQILKGADIPFSEAYSIMKNGIRGYKERRVFK